MEPHQIYEQGARIAFLAGLKRSQWMSRAELAKRQLTKLKAIVRYAYRTIPFYHRVFDAAGFKPEDLTHLRDLRKIPITTRVRVGECHEEFLPASLDQRAIGRWWDDKPYTRISTSGSTGISIKVINDRTANTYSAALRQYAFQECGVHLLDRFAVFWNRRNTTRYYAARPPSRLRDWMLTLTYRFRPIIVTVSDPLDATIQQLRAIDPTVLYIYTDVLEDFCHSDTAGIHPRLLFTQASTLTPHLRELVRRKFGIEPFDTYGSMEFNRLAFECPAHAGLHVITDGAVVECLDDAGDPVASGEAGETVVTGLYNRAMPLIRYELGDLAVPLDDPCPCGRSWPLLREIQGRKNDRFILPSGRVVGRRAFHGAFHTDQPWCIAQRQVVQLTKNHIRLRFVKGPAFEPHAIDDILARFTAVIADDRVTVDYEVVPSIPRSPAEKRKFMISHVA
jgi:phenylacetate-CoA ligase